MSRICQVCGKRQHAGNSVSHSNKKTRRVWRPNIQRLLVEVQGARQRRYVCTQCLKSGKVRRPAPESRPPEQETVIPVE